MSECLQFKRRSPLLTSEEEPPLPRGFGRGGGEGRLLLPFFPEEAGEEEMFSYGWLVLGGATGCFPPPPSSCCRDDATEFLAGVLRGRGRGVFEVVQFS